MKFGKIFIGVILTAQIFFAWTGGFGENDSVLTLWPNSHFFLHGQTVTISGTLKSGNGPVQGVGIGILVINPAGGPFFADQPTTDSMGHFQVTFRLPESALLGSYTIQGAANGIFVSANFQVVAALPPLPPENVSISPGLNSVHLFWRPSTSPNAFYYLVYRKAPGETQFTKVATTSSLEFLDNSAMACGLPYVYVVSAADSTGYEGDLSPQASAIPWGHLSSFLFDPVASPQNSGIPFSIRIQAVDDWGITVKDFTSSVNLSFPPGISGTISPTMTGNFVQGEWSGSVVLTGTGTVSIQASYLEARGVSNSFTLREPSQKSLLLHSGWNLVSIPFSTSPYPTEIFFTLPQPWRAYWWNPSGFCYLSKNQPFICPGRSFWVKSPADALITFEGEELRDDCCTFDLFPGWNMIGVPYSRTFSFREVFFSTGTATYNFSSAVSAGLIRNAAYFWNGSRYEDAYKTGSGLEPFRGYWLKVLKPCKITFFKERKASDANESSAFSISALSSYPLSLSFSFQNSAGVPISPPFRRGSTVLMVATIQNNSSETLPFLLVFNTLDPSGAPFSFSTVSGTVGPNQQAVVSSSLSFPMNAQTGDYLVRVFGWNSWPSQSWRALSLPCTAVCGLIP